MATKIDSGLEIRPLSPVIGVEISGVDWRKGVDDATFQRIYDAWLEHCLVLFRGQDLTQDQQIAVGERFGEVGKLLDMHKRKVPDFAEPDPRIVWISNIRKDGAAIGMFPDGEMYFHSDFAYVEEPHKATMLYCIECEGGNTVFSNMFRAYETLPGRTKKIVDEAKALFGFADGYYNQQARWWDEEKLDRSYYHPVVRTHPETGRKALFVNRMMTVRIDGLDKAESDEVLEQLFAQVETPENHYEHVWTPGDMLLWDNRSTTHARTDFADTERRLFRRLTLLGDKPF